MNLSDIKYEDLGIEDDNKETPYKPRSIDEIIDDNCEEFGVPPSLGHAIAQQESGKKTGRTSTAGAGGIMQLMPRTAAYYKVKDINDPEDNIRGGVNLLKDLLEEFGSFDMAIAAYKAGAGSVRKAGRVPKPDDPGGYDKYVNETTEDYVKKVLSHVEKFKYKNIENLSYDDLGIEDDTEPPSPKLAQSSKLEIPQVTEKDIEPQEEVQSSTYVSPDYKTKPESKKPGIIETGVKSLAAGAANLGSSIVGAYARGAERSGEKLEKIKEKIKNGEELTQEESYFVGEIGYATPMKEYAGALKKGKEKISQLTPQTWKDVSSEAASGPMLPGKDAGWDDVAKTWVAIAGQTVPYLATAAIPYVGLPLTMASQSETYSEEAEKLGIPSDVIEKYNGVFGIANGLIEKAQSVTMIGKPAKAIGKPIQKGIIPVVKKVLGLAGEGVAEGLEEGTQGKLMEVLLRKAIEDTKKSNPDWNPAIPEPEYGWNAFWKDFGAGAGLGMLLKGTSLATRLIPKSADAKTEVTTEITEPLSPTEIEKRTPVESIAGKGAIIEEEVPLEQTKPEETGVEPEGVKPVVQPDKVEETAVARQFGEIKKEISEKGKSELPEKPVVQWREETREDYSPEDISKIAESIDPDNPDTYIKISTEKEVFNKIVKDISVESKTVTDILSEAAKKARTQINENNKSLRMVTGLPLDDIYNYAVIGAEKIHIGTKKFMPWAREMLSEFGKYIKPHLKKIWEKAKSFNKWLGEEGSIKWGKKKDIEITTGIKKQPEVKEELSNLKSAFQKVQRFTKSSYKAGEMTARAKLISEANKKNQDIKKMYDSIVDYSRSKDFTNKERGEILAGVAFLKTEKNKNKIIEHIDRIADKRDKRIAIDKFKKTVKSIPDKMYPEYKGAISDLMEDIDTSKLTSEKAGRLAALDEMISKGTVNKSMIPQELVKDIDRLHKRAISEFSTEDIELFTDRLNEYINLNKAEKILETEKKIKGYKEDYKIIDNELAKYNKEKPPKEGGKPDTFIQKTGKKAENVYSMIGGLKAENAETVLEKMGSEKLKKTIYDETADKGRDKELDAYFKISEELISKFDVKNFKKYSTMFNHDIKSIVKQIDLPSGKKIHMTVGEIMGLYNSVKREHNLKALLKEKTVLARDVTENAIGKEYKLDIDDLEKIASNLTEEQKNLADWMFEKANTDFKSLLNETSVKLNGYEIAKEDNYWRLMRTDLYRDYLTKGMSPNEEIGKFLQEKTIEGHGSLKAIKEKATGTVVVEDAFKTFYDSMSLATKYNAYAENFRKVKQLLHDLKVNKVFDKYGKGKELEYLKKYMSDLEGSVSAPQNDFDKMINNAMSNIAKGILGMNPSVVFKQYASYITAMTEIEPKYLLKAIIMDNKTAFKEIKELSPQLRMRIEGHVIGRDLSSRASITQINKFFGQEDPLLDKQLGFVHGADKRVIGWLWNASKLKAQAEKGFVKDIAEKTVRNTQPTYDAKDRSEVARSGSTLSRAMSMFTSVTNKALQIPKRKWAEYQKSEKTFNDKYEFAKNCAIVLASTAGAMTIIDEIRDRLFFGKKELDMEKTVWKFARNTIQQLYFVGPVVDISKLAYDKFTGKKTWNAVNDITGNIVTNMAADVIDAATDIPKNIKEENMYKLYNNTVKFISSAGALFGGIAIGNVYKYGGKQIAESLGVLPENPSKKKNKTYYVP